MKKITWSLSTLILASLFVKASDPGFVIIGKLDERRSGVIYLNIYGDEVIKNSAKIVQGVFMFKGFIQRPTQAVLEIKDSKEDYIEFYLEPDTIKISGKGFPLKDIVINSPLNNEDKLLKTQMEPVSKWQIANAKAYEEASKNKNERVLDSLDEEDFAVLKEKKKIITSFVKNYPHSMRGAMAIKEVYAYYTEADEVEFLYNLLDEDLRHTPTGKDIKSMIDVYKTVAVGAIPPDITQATPDGTPMSLYSLRGKYVLVDFWASWCPPCRRENPNVVKLFNEYKNKGFDIFGVSYDDKKEKWEKAIKDDKLSWTQVSDLKGWRNATSDLYGIRAIPSNLLLDKEGRIIAKNIFGKKLPDKLAEVIK